MEEVDMEEVGMKEVDHPLPGMFHTSVLHQVDMEEPHLGALEPRRGRPSGMSSAGQPAGAPEEAGGGDEKTT
eukprot:COSAG04_NODE_643_length_11662_cov_7.578051_3_plen_72_part_00